MMLAKRFNIFLDKKKAGRKKKEKRKRLEPALSPFYIYHMYLYIQYITRAVPAGEKKWRKRLYVGAKAFFAGEKGTRAIN